MTLSFPALLILLLPGFFSLWVYQGFCFEDVHKRGEAHVISLGLMFGMVNIGVYGLLGLMPCFDLTLPINDNVASLTRWDFLWRYTVLSVLALLIGLFSGLLCRANWTPAALLRKFGASLAHINETENTESLLHVFLQEHTKDGSQVIIEIQSDSGSVMGFYGGDGLNSDGEIQLTRTDLFLYLDDGDRELLTLLPSYVFFRPNGAIIRVALLTAQQCSDLANKLDGKAYERIKAFQAAWS